LSIFFVAEEVKPSGFPRIAISPTVKTVELSRDVSLGCVVEGNPAPTVIWYKDYKPLHVDGSRITVDPSGAWCIDTQVCIFYWHVCVLYAFFKFSFLVNEAAIKPLSLYLSLVTST